MKGLELRILDKLILLQSGDSFYCADPSLEREVRKALEGGKKFLATDKLRIPTKHLPILIASKQAKDLFPEVSYYIQGSKIPHIVTPKKIGDWTVYEADFI